MKRDKEMGKILMKIFLTMVMLPGHQEKRKIEISRLCSYENIMLRFFVDSRRNEPSNMHVSRAFSCQISKIGTSQLPPTDELDPPCSLIEEYSTKIPRQFIY